MDELSSLSSTDLAALNSMSDGDMDSLDATDDSVPSSVHIEIGEIRQDEFEEDEDDEA